MNKIVRHRQKHFRIFKAKLLPTKKGLKAFPEIMAFHQPYTVLLVLTSSRNDLLCFKPLVAPEL